MRSQIICTCKVRQCQAEFDPHLNMKLTCLNVNSAISGFLTAAGGVSGRRGLSAPISEPLDSLSCICSTLELPNDSCLRRCSLRISSRMFSAIFSEEEISSPSGLQLHHKAKLTWCEFGRECRCLSERRACRLHHLCCGAG